MTLNYTVKVEATKHTCWDSPKWDGTMQDTCAGCDEAAGHKCRFCGYGRLFATHNDLAHTENGDTLVPDSDKLLDPWIDHPHIYSQVSG